MKRLAPLLAASSMVAAVTTVAMGTRASAPAGRYTTNAGTVLDTKTNLTWQLATNTFPQTNAAAPSVTAAAYCQSSLGGPWRVPTMKELLTLVDYSTSSPAIDKTFTDTPGSPTWSSTLVAGGSDAAWYVNFADGSWSQDSLEIGHTVRCVK